MSDNANTKKSGYVEVSLKSDESDARFFSRAGNDVQEISIKEANELAKTQPYARYLRITTIDDYKQYLIDKSGTKLMKGQYPKAPKPIRGLLDEYAFFGQKQENANNIKKVRKAGIERAKIANVPPLTLETRIKLQRNLYNTAKLSDIVYLDSLILQVSKYKKLLLIQQIVVPQIKRAMEFIYNKYITRHPLINVKNLRQDEIFRMLSIIDDIKFNHTPHTEIGNKLHNKRKQYIDSIRQYYLNHLGEYSKHKNTNQRISKLIELNKIEKTKKVGEFKKKYETSDIGKFKTLLKNYKNDVKRLGILGFNSKEINSFTLKIKNILDALINTSINKLQTSSALNVNEKKSERLTKYISNFLGDTNVKNILSNSKSSSYYNKLKNTRTSLKRKKRQEEKENTKEKYEAYLERIKNTTENINLNSIKNEFGEKSPYFIKLQTALRTRKVKSGNVPYKIYNQIKNEQIKKFKKDGNPYPLNYFKNRYGYTNKQLEILKSSYVNKLEDEYNDVDKKYINELNRTQRQFYASLINALKKLSRGFDTQTYSEMVSNAKKTKKEKMQALKKEYGSKFSSELRKRSPNEIKMLDNKRKSYIAQYKKAVRTIKRIIAAKKRASRKKIM